MTSLLQCTLIDDGDLVFGYYFLKETSIPLAIYGGFTHIPRKVTKFYLKARTISIPFAYRSRNNNRIIPIFCILTINS